MRLAIGVCLALSVVLAAPASASVNSQSNLKWFSDESMVGQGAHTDLRRTDDGVSANAFARQLTSGNALTVWLAIFNTPDGCLDGCGEDDLFNPDATPSVIWSGGSGIPNPAGNLNVRGALGEGNPQGYQQLFADLGMPDPGFVDAEGAEIHFVVRDHGPASTDPDELEAQLTSFEGGCTPESSFGLGTGAYDCEDVQFSIHLP